MFFDLKKSSYPTFSHLTLLFLFIICSQCGSCPLGPRPWGRMPHTIQMYRWDKGRFPLLPLYLLTSDVSRILFSSCFWKLPLPPGSQQGLLGSEKSQWAHDGLVALNSEPQSPGSLVIIGGDSHISFICPSKCPRTEE